MRRVSCFALVSVAVGCYVASPVHPLGAPYDAGPAGALDGDVPLVDARPDALAPAECTDLVTGPVGFLLPADYGFGSLLPARLEVVQVDIVGETQELVLGRRGQVMTSLSLPIVHAPFALGDVVFIQQSGRLLLVRGETASVIATTQGDVGPAEPIPVVPGAPRFEARRGCLREWITHCPGAPPNPTFAMEIRAQLGTVEAVVAPRRIATVGDWTFVEPHGWASERLSSPGCFAAETHAFGLVAVGPPVAAIAVPSVDVCRVLGDGTCTRADAGGHCTVFGSGLYDEVRDCVIPDARFDCFPGVAGLVPSPRCVLWTRPDGDTVLLRAPTVWPGDLDDPALTPCSPGMEPRVLHAPTCP